MKNDTDYKSIFLTNKQNFYKKIFFDKKFVQTKFDGKISLMPVHCWWPTCSKVHDGIQLFWPALKYVRRILKNSDNLPWIVVFKRSFQPAYIFWPVRSTPLLPTLFITSSFTMFPQRFLLSLPVAEWYINRIRFEGSKFEIRYNLSSI